VDLFTQGEKVDAYNFNFGDAVLNEGKYIKPTGKLLTIGTFHGERFIIEFSGALYPPAEFHVRQKIDLFEKARNIWRAKNRDGRQCLQIRIHEQSGMYFYFVGRG
jgi:hypothetical protein